MKTTLFYAISGGAVNRELGVITGVSVITAGPAKGHYTYSEEGERVPMIVDETTLSQVLDLMVAFGADGVRVKADHWTGFDAIVGTIKNPQLSGKQLKGDLHLLKEDDSFDRILEMTQKMPSQFGLSISFSGKSEIKTVQTEAGTQTQIACTRCTELYSIDLVDDPAANPSGIFSTNVDSKNNLEMTIAELIPGLFGKDGTVTELQTTLATERTNLAAAQSEVTNLKSKVSELTAELSKIKGERDAFEVTISKPDGEIEKRAGLKAKELMAALGVTAPLPTEPAVQGQGDIFVKFQAIKDPVERQMFYRKNKEAFDMGYRAWVATQPQSVSGLKFKS